MKVFRAVVEVTVMLDAESETAAKNELENMELADIVREMDDGSFLGTHRLAKLREVPAEDVAMEERALGADGSFFAELGEA